MLDKSRPVLVVDDSRAMCAIITKILARLEFTDVDTVCGALDALAQLRTRTYELLIVDWEMSPISGPDLIARIHNDKTISVPVIVLTTANHQWVADLVNGRSTSGADIHILKPFTPAALAAKLADASPKREFTLV